MKNLKLLCAALLAAPAFAAAPAPILIDTPRAHNESITATADGTIYAGSLVGIIFRAKPGEAKATSFITADERNGLQATLGVLADEKSNTLWACAMPNPFAGKPTPGVMKVVAFNLQTGAWKADYPFPEGPRLCNDLAVGADGTLFATDTIGSRIFMIAPGARELTLFAADREQLMGVDGIAFTADGTLYVNNVIRSTLLRVNRNADGSFAGLTVLQPSQPMKGPDGLRPISGNRLLQGEGPGGRVTELTVSGDKVDVRVLAEGIEGPTGVTMARGTTWHSESRIGSGPNGPTALDRPGPFRIVPVAGVKP